MKPVDFSNHQAKGLAGAWPLDDRNDLIAKDLSNNRNNASLTNYAIWSNDGSAYFGGAAAANYVNLGDPVALDLSSVLSLSVWVKKSTASQNAGIFCKWYSGSNNTNCFVLSFGQDAANDKISFAILQTNISVKSVAPSDSSIPAGVWTHIVAVANGSVLKLYRDGVPYSTTTAYDGTINTSTRSAIIGRLRTEDTTYSLTGNVKDARVYNRVLSDGEIKDMYYSSKELYLPMKFIHRSYFGIAGSIYRPKILIF